MNPFTQNPISSSSPFGSRLGLQHTVHRATILSQQKIGVTAFVYGPLLYASFRLGPPFMLRNARPVSGGTIGPKVLKIAENCTTDHKNR